jgi:DNA invertase Pin-like site-specific DNA recombinase
MVPRRILPPPSGKRFFRHLTESRYIYTGRKPKIDRAEVRRLRESGLSASVIAQQLGVGRASVYRVLENESKRDELSPYITVLISGWIMLQKCRRL